jgi:hypothetical protein
VNILYLQKHFDFSGGEKGSRVGKYISGEIKSYCECYYDIDYIQSYLDKGKKGFEDYILNFIVEKKIDYIIFTPLSHDTTIDPLFLEKLHKISTIVMLFGDGEYYFEKVHRYYAQVSDLVLYFGNYHLKALYELLDIKTIHFKAHFDTSVYRGLEPCKTDIDVSFVGTMQANRGLYIEFLEKQGVALEQYGYGSKNGIIPFDKMVNVFQRSKLNLHFTSLAAPGRFIVYPSKLNQRIKQYKGRLVEVPLSGGFLLTEYMPDIEHFFKVGEECDVFYSEKDLLEKIKYYLEHDDERERIARKGQERALRDYDVRKGVRDFIDSLRDVKKSNATVYLDDDFIRLYANKRFYYSAYFISRAELGKLMQELQIVLSNIRFFSVKKAFLFFLAGITETVLGENIRKPFRKFKFYSYLRKIPKY